MTLTTIIIDDSPLQQLATSKLINDNPSLKLQGIFENPKSGLEAIKSLRPDIVFLDVEMPGMNGFEVLESLDCNCQVILNSTRPEFAFQAFRYDHVKDYVTKPMKRDRFEKAVDKVMKNEAAQHRMEKVFTVPVYHERPLQAS